MVSNYYSTLLFSNEDDVGQGVREQNIPRKDVFVVTKVNTEGHGYEQCKQAVSTSLKKLVTNNLTTVTCVRLEMW